MTGRYRYPSPPLIVFRIHMNKDECSNSRGTKRIHSRQINRSSRATQLKPSDNFSYSISRSDSHIESLHFSYFRLFGRPSSVTLRTPFIKENPETDDAFRKRFSQFRIERIAMTHHRSGSGCTRSLNRNRHAPYLSEILRDQRC